MKIKNDFSLNVVPLIDVMLVLLTIVLFSASFIEYSKLDVNLPKDGNSAKQFDKKKIDITLTSQNEIYFDENLADISDLKELLKDIDKETLVVFRGDTSSHFGNFVEILSILKEINHSNFTIQTELKK